MTTERSPLAAVGVALALGLGAAGAAAQEPVLAPVRGHGDGAFIAARPVGEFAEHVDRGWGFRVGGALPLRERHPLGLRVEAGAINYGRERGEVCVSSTIGCRVRVDLTTTNDIVFAGFGPQLEVPVGPVRPYARATVGFAVFSTSSSIRGLGDSESIASTTHHRDFTFALTGGGGVRVALATGKTPVFLDLGARYHDHGRVTYLREGDIEDRPDGSIVLHPRRSDANLLSLHLGVSVGIRAPQRE
jgi:opacity protein-like surface antigen